MQNCVEQVLNVCESATIYVHCLNYVGEGGNSVENFLFCIVDFGTAIHKHKVYERFSLSINEVKLNHDFNPCVMKLFQLCSVI